MPLGSRGDFESVPSIGFGDDMNICACVVARAIAVAATTHLRCIVMYLFGLELS